jgi:hypothetical protein
VAIFGLAWVAINTEQKRPHAEIAENGAQQNIPQETLRNPSDWQPITWFTLFLVVVGAGQAALFFWQLGLIRNGADDAKMAAEAAMNSADAAAKQTELAREQFTASHRPLLVVRRPELRVFGKEQRIVIQFTVANVGQSDAHDVSYKVDAVLTETGKNLSGLSYFRTPPKYLGFLEMGGYENVFFEDEVFLVDIDYEAVKNGTHDLLFFGEVGYRDTAKMVRRTGFVRRYDNGLRRFCLTGDPDHEYQD